MAGLLEKTWLALPATKTYQLREAEWVPLGNGEGYLILTRSTRLFRSRAKLNRSLYAVQEQPAVGRLGRVFLVMNQSDVEAPEPYETFIGQPVNRCTCKAAKCKVPGDDDTDGCAHRDALALLIEAGEL